VALVAPGGPVDDDRIARSQDRCRTLGLEPVLFPSARSRRGYLAGRDDDRLSDLQAAIDDPTIDGVWALRGGYGTIRIVDRLILERQLKDPVPFVGFSDNTSIHVEHAALGIISFHGPHPGGDFPPETEASFRRVLYSEEPAGQISGAAGDPAPRTLVAGIARGPLWGGNLATLVSLCGSSSRLSGAGRILFLEDVGEPAYRVDRMLTQLARAGVLHGVKGLAFGRFSEVSPAEGEAVASTLKQFAEEHGVPSAADLPFGHTKHNCTLPIGALARLDAEAGTLTILAGAVERSRGTVLPVS
jgi:muramoyltetrapeptide carboxypeptidase